MATKEQLNSVSLLLSAARVYEKKNGSPVSSASPDQRVPSHTSSMPVSALLSDSNCSPINNVETDRNHENSSNNAVVPVLWNTYNCNYTKLARPRLTFDKSILSGDLLHYVTVATRPMATAPTTIAHRYGIANTLTTLVRNYSIKVQYSTAHEICPFDFHHSNFLPLR